jgi:hypothetical protein
MSRFRLYVSQRQLWVNGKIAKKDWNQIFNVWSVIAGPEKRFCFRPNDLLNLFY